MEGKLCHGDVPYLYGIYNIPIYKGLTAGEVVK